MKTTIIYQVIFMVTGLTLCISCEQDSLTKVKEIEESVDSRKSNTEKAYPDGIAGEVMDIDFFGESITVEKIDDQYVFEGDIIMNPHSHTPSQKSVGRTQARWSNNIVYYEIENGISDPNRILQAIEHWQANTYLRFIPRTNQPNYIYFRTGTGCSSNVGRVGGRQYINLAPDCDKGAIIHEIGHSVGLWHEQSRKDRNQHLLVNIINVEPGKEHNFYTYQNMGMDGDEYTDHLDFSSIMLYDSYAFSRNGLPTMTKKNGYTFTTNRTHLSFDDVVGIKKMYPSTVSFARWATRQGGYTNGQKWLSGDFNGDGKDDFAKVFDDRGYASIDVHLSTGSGFYMRRWATRQGGYADAQKWVSGDFNGDGKHDFAKAFNDNGYASIDVHLSTGSGFYMRRWATRQGGYADAQKWLAGDFNGDGKDDFAKAFNDNGYASIDVHSSNGASFSMSRWVTRQGGFWDAQKWMSGDYNGDGKDDFAKVFNDNGYASMDVHISNNNTFSMARWATKQSGFWSAQKWLSGDFDGDGKHDFSKVFNDNGLATIDVHFSNGNSFNHSLMVTRQGGYSSNQKWNTGDFNGDGKDDFTKAFNDNNLISLDVHAN
ncbi:M12 family metallopeptidase [Aquimarina aquimarini]|uniref:M12 family metallopeptidase n=1 Tax=Aquimarina aquimarini TaxID=1191734 RepID=UPI000D557710|nr:M12 family metallopeptidase [Aquimarina aquimarini]